MLKRMFALSDQGSRDLNKGIAATTLSNLCLIAPVSLLVMVIWELLNVISGQESSMQDHAALTKRLLLWMPRVKRWCRMPCRCC